MIWCLRNRNAETLRTQSCCPHASSAPSASPRFKTFADKHGHVLTPGRYVGVEEVEDDGIPFADKMATLTAELADQFTESAKFEKAIRKNMKSLGFELPVGGTK